MIFDGTVDKKIPLTHEGRVLAGENFNMFDMVKCKSDGDFRNEECKKFLKEADIVVTNPPFSLFREFIRMLVEYDKKFLVIGNFNAVTYKEIFPLIKKNKMRLGYNWIKKFITPDGNLQKFGNICWYTNLNVSKHHKNIELYREYNEQDYPKYDNYDAINVDRLCDIPCDYYGVIGVPISFLDKYNPEQFEILGCTANPESNSVEKKVKSNKALELISKGRLVGAKCVGGNSNIYIDKNDYVHVLYHRVLIRRVTK